MWPLSLFKFSISSSPRSPKWKQVRKEHLLKQPNCMVCGSSLKPEVHHIVPVHVDPSKELDSNNLITLCDKYCHFIFGHFMNWWSYNPDIIQDAHNFHAKILHSRGENA